MFSRGSKDSMAKNLNLFCRLAVKDFKLSYYSKETFFIHYTHIMVT